MALLVADVRALSAGQYELLVVYGDTAAGDGGGGFYVWNSTSTDTDDGAEWIKPDSVGGGSPGRWERVWIAPPGTSNILFGTTAGTVTEGNDDRIPDATEQSFLATVTMSGDNITITPAGTGTITLSGNVTIVGNVTVTDGTNNVVITPTSDIVEV